MRCHVCNVAVGDGQRFCHECGESLNGVTDATGPHPVIGDAVVGDAVIGDAVIGDAVIDDDDATLDVEPDTRDTETADHIPGDDEIPSDDDVTVETGGAATGSDEPVPLESETVTPPTPAPVSQHRGALPDLAAPPVGDADTAWWATGGDAPADDLPHTEPIDVIAAPPLTGEAAIEAKAMSTDDGLPATEAMAVTPSSATVPRSNLDSVSYEPMGDEPIVDRAPHYEPTTTMPATGAPVRGLGVTDDFAQSGPGGVGSTAEMAVTGPGGLFDGGADNEEFSPESEGFRLRASFVFGFLALVATLMASVADVIDIRTTRPVGVIFVGIRVLDDFGSNLAVAGFIGAGLMLVGGLLSCFGLRWGAGMAGGAGLSMTGWAAISLGFAETEINNAKVATINAGEAAAFTLSITRDLGYFLILAIGVLGVVVFVTSLRMAGAGGRRGLNPWIAAVGALAAVVLAAGPLITLDGIPLDANLGTLTFPREFHAARLVQLGLIVVTGVVGFLSVRTYGLGLAAGGLGVTTWMWVTSLAEVGPNPRSVGAFNLGSTVTTPHAVTTVGVTASLALLLIAATVATVTRRRA